MVELRRVNLLYGRLRALRDLDFSIGPGEIVTVIGESGCGKSTLGRAVLGLVRPTSGQVLYQGQDIHAPGYQMPDELRLSVQVVHQDSYASLNPVRTVGQTLAAPLLRHGGETKRTVASRVEKILTEVGLTPADFFANKLPYQLSGGQRQRVSLARAAMLRPRLIVADEPVSGVDATLRLAILDLMRRLNQEEGIAFLYITHDLATARYLGQRMMVMYLGEVIEAGHCDDLLSRPAHPYLQALLAALPPLDPRRARTAGPLPLRSLDLPDPAAPPPGCSFHPRCPHWQDLCVNAKPALEERKPLRYVACHYPWEGSAQQQCEPGCHDERNP